ncbi:MAG: hypothetical protein ACLSDO_01085 [Anaerotruncus colihominis]
MCYIAKFARSSESNDKLIADSAQSGDAGTPGKTTLFRHRSRDTCAASAVCALDAADTAQACIA